MGLGWRELITPFFSPETPQSTFLVWEVNFPCDHVMTASLFFFFFFFRGVKV